MVVWRCLPWLALLLVYLHCSTTCYSVQAQFLFTYEINQEDDTRTPKSTLFDPNSFKIVTPSQLQSSYAKISSQLSSMASSHSPSHQQQQVSVVEPSHSSITIPPPVPHHQRTSSHQPAGQSATTGSFLKQTSSALQSFAELLNFAPNSATQPQIPLPSGAHTQVLPRQQHTPSEQQVDTHSLSEHWTQPRHRTHPAEVASTFASVNSVEDGAPGPALSSFTTATSHPNPSVDDVRQHRTQAGSYWLTGNGQANTQDGSFLFEIKPPGSAFMDAHDNNDQRTSTVSFPDNLVSLTNAPPRAGLPKPSFPLRQAQENHQQTNMAQTSFLSTPTTYYPSQTSETPAPTGLPPVMRHQQQFFRPQMHQQSSISQHQHISHQPKLESASQFHMNISQLQPMRSLRAIKLQPVTPALEDSSSQQQQLNPPANLPEHFVDSSLRGPALVLSSSSPLRSAEEALNAFRALQGHPSRMNQEANQRKHQEQLSLQRQHQKPSKQLLSAVTPASAVIFPIDNGIEQLDRQQVVQQQQQQQQQKPHHSEGTVKISPQIYESFLLQQKDQHEKHMELLKQQQELNRLIEQQQQQQKQKQAENEKEAARKRRKKEEQEKEVARKRARQEFELAQQKKLKQELEERKRRELEERKRRELEERKRREYEEEKRRQLEEEKRRREYEEQKRRKLEEEQKQRAEAEELERKQLEERRYREFLEARDRELRRREEEELEQAKKREAAKKRQEEEESNKFLRQKEELRRLLELKAREEQDLEARRKQVVARGSQVERANKLAQELRDRVALSAWTAPMRLRSTSTTTEPTPLSSTSPLSTSTSGISTASESPTESTIAGSSERPTTTGRQRILSRVAKKQRVSTGNEKLIRQKIPLYSGPGQYGLYRGANSSLDSDLAALLDSVTLPAPRSTTTTTTTTTTSTTSTTTPIPLSRSPVTTSESFSSTRSSSLSPLLRTDDPNSIAFDDDVPRRPVRNLSRTGNGLLHQSASDRQASTIFPRSSFNESSTISTTPLSTGSSSGSGNQRHAHIGLASLPPDADNDGIPGRAGVEYPVLSQVPSTSFSCAKQPLNGYYADTETACQVVHLCQGGVQSSILCPNGTIFNQEKFSCQWWYEVNCSRAPMFYQLNDNLYKGPRLGPSSTGSQQDRAANVEKKRRQIAAS